MKHTIDPHNILSLPLIAMKSKSIKIGIPNFTLLGSVNGKWSGNIMLKTVQNGNYAFAYYNSYIYNNNMLPIDAAQLYNNGDTYVLAEMMYLLGVADGGFADKKSKSTYSEFKITRRRLTRSPMIG